MKRLSFLAFALIALCSCKKNSNQPKPVQLPPTDVTYTFTSNQIDTYTIRYTDSNKTASTAIITGNSWSKVLKLAASPNHANLTLYVESANKSFNASGNLSIAVDGHNTASMPLSSSVYTYGMRGQIIYELDNTFGN